MHNNEEQRKTNADTTITFLEAKQYGKALDTKKTSAKENPYFQLLEYMLYFRKNFGFLCNGFEWWLLDNTKEKTNKPYIAANLEEIAYNNNFEAFCLFYILFAKETYISDEELATQPIYKELVRNSALLSLCHNKEAFKEIQDELKIADSEIPKTPKAIHTLQARNDVLVAGLYGISKTEMAYILESFKVLNDKKPEYVQLLLSMM